LGYEEDLYYNLASLYGKSGDRVSSHYYFGLYFKAKNRADSALFHFRAARELITPEDGAPKRSIPKSNPSEREAQAGAPLLIFNGRWGISHKGEVNSLIKDKMEKILIDLTSFGHVVHDRQGLIQGIGFL